MLRQICLALICLTSIAAHAIEPDEWVIRGIGNKSCGSYVISLADNKPSDAMIWEGKTYPTEANAYVQWIDGFITAINLVSRKPGTHQILVDSNGVALWIKNYCDAHPSEAIVDGVSAFVKAHPPNAK